MFKVTVHKQVRSFLLYSYSEINYLTVYTVIMCRSTAHYLVFYIPKKPDKTRAVFDSSVKFHRVSLNSVLLSGPKFVNDLTSVLLQFRKDAVGIMADIEQMFYRFLVTNEHRDFLWFYWYRNNDLNKELIEYRMKVHVFGNTPSPGVAMYGLQNIVENADYDVKSYGYKIPMWIMELHQYQLVMKQWIYWRKLNPCYITKGKSDYTK